jgi:selenocysteine lyase/cysteine desulfurase
MKRGTLEKIAPYPGEQDPKNELAYKRIHTATTNFAAFLSVPAALDFHEKIGGANKEARLRHLRKLWTDDAESLDGIEILGGLDEASSTGMASFRIKGKNTTQDAVDLQQVLEKEFGLFTVIRLGLASGACVRITPQVFTRASNIVQLSDALRVINSRI